MRKRQSHNQKQFVHFIECIITSSPDELTRGDWGELADILKKNEIKDIDGNPYTKEGLKQQVHRWNKKPKDEDFRQEYWEKVEEYICDEPSIYNLSKNDSEPDMELTQEQLDAEQFKFIEEHRKGENYSEKKSRESMDKQLQKIFQSCVTEED